MKRKIIISLAPTGPWGKGGNNPLLPEDLKREVSAGIDAGASVVHLHSRKPDGSLSSDVSLLQESVAAIRNERDFVFEASTGGVSVLSAEERIRPVSIPQAELGSLNMGSLNFGDEVYQNLLPDIRYWVETMARYNVRPSLEIFDTGHLECAVTLMKEDLVPSTSFFSFIFGVRWGMVYSRQLLEYLVRRIPSESSWGCIFVGSRNFDHHLNACESGADAVRVGFEDSRLCCGKEFESNAGLVEYLASSLENLGYGIADAAEARAMLDL